jgi:hypothetical protein
MLEGVGKDGDMVLIEFVLLGAGLVVVAALALADPVLLSRVNGEPARGPGGRHLQNAEVVRLPRRTGDDRQEPQAA